MTITYVLPLSDGSATLEVVGGKGVSLARLAAAGFPIPAGFHVTTGAYRRFCETNGLQPIIRAALKGVQLLLPQALESASAAIKKQFLAGVMPAEIASSIRDGYAALRQSAVAIRSSATAEDLPQASFAGQQETYLNISGAEAVLEAVRLCWASLWTARAIAYRLKNNLDQNNIALAVVVQEMVSAEAAGILFTANPVNGRRGEVVINAAWGLGEAVVGGLVTPDTLTVDKATGKIIRKEIAEKRIISVPVASGTQDKPLTGARSQAQVLREAEVVKLTSLARRIEGFYGCPQDIEWCLANGEFYIVQSRPITALPAAALDAPSEWKLPKGAYAAMRNNIVELMAEPLSPLFATLGLAAINTSLHRLMEGSFGMRAILPKEIIVTVNQYAYFNGSISAGAIARMVFGVRKILRMMLSRAVERWTVTGRPLYYQTINAWKTKEWQSFTSVELANSAGKLTEAAIDAYGALVSGVIPVAWMTEAVFTRVYNALIKRRGDPAAPTFLLGYDSIPIQADKALYSQAEWASQYPSLVTYLESLPTSELAVKLALDDGGITEVPVEIWREWRQRFQEYLQKYGHTLYDLDFAHPLPVDDPLPVLEAFKLYLRGEGVNPYDRQCDSAECREEAVRATRARIKGLRLKWFNQSLASAQKFAPLREDGLAEVGLAYPLIRQMLRELGRRFSAQRLIPTVDDIYWMTEGEVLLNAAQNDAGLPGEPVGEIILQRKAEHRAAMQAYPPRILPQMKVFGFDLMSLKAKRGRRGKRDVIRGVAASPGKVTGIARVLHGPGDFSRMVPGDVLVAPITTPAWTPLFAMACAVVTDVGGPLSHGSIVAREYGIPAVLGTETATRRIQDGQTITVDGSAGIIKLKNGIS